MADTDGNSTNNIIKETANTRLFIENLIKAVSLDNFGPSFANALSEDLVWTVTGSAPLSGRYEGRQVYIDKVLTPLRGVLDVLPFPIVEHIFVDRDWAIIQWRSEDVRGKNGADYSMQYCWMMRVEKEKIVEVIGFFDAIKMINIFAGSGFKGL